MGAKPRQSMQGTSAGQRERQCPLVAQSRHAQCADKCPLLGTNRTVTRTEAHHESERVGLGLTTLGVPDPIIERSRANESRPLADRAVRYDGTIIGELAPLGFLTCLRESLDHS